ncbi:MAG: GntR family transcriptional regulator [Spirochaetales bacterium]|nr:GntR family transcriptional regulator [Spirochaetales bacterium]
MKKNQSMYKTIASKLRERILSEEIKPSEKLPSERELCEHFRVSRLTIRKVLDVLEKERLVLRRQGSGTYVSPNSGRRIPLLIDYTGSMKEYAPDLNRTVLIWKWQEAVDWAAKLLNIPPGEQIFYSERVDNLEENPAAWDQVYIPRSFAYKLSENELSRVDFLEGWTKACDFKVESCSQYIEAVSASTDICRNLKIVKGHAVLKSTEIYYTFHNRPAGLFISYYHPKYITIASQFRWGSIEREKNRKENIYEKQH